MHQLAVAAAVSMLVVVVVILTMAAEAAENTCCRPFKAKNRNIMDMMFMMRFRQYS
jgi:hypothetical protein